MLTSNVIEYASIEFITQKKAHNVVLHDMVMFPAVLTFVCDLYHVTLTSSKSTLSYSNSPPLNTII